MKFRISHLLTATVVVAVLAATLANPTPTTIVWLNFAMLLTGLTFASRAVCVSGRERRVIICGLMAAVGYLLALRYMELPTGSLLWELRPKLSVKSNLQGPQLYAFMSSSKAAGDFIVEIGHRGIGILIGCAAALLALYWTRNTEKT